MKVTITDKETISDLYDMLSTKVGFCLSLESIDSIVIDNNNLIILDNRNNWIGNFNCINDINNYLESKFINNN